MTLTAANAQEPLERILLDAITDYAIFTLDCDGFVTSWNAGAERVKGYRAIEIMGQHFSRFFTAEDRERGVPENVLRTTRIAGRHESEGWRVRKGGGRFCANATTHAIRDAHGQLRGFVKITRDITERVTAQQALLESERRFRILVEGVVDYAIYMLDPSGIVTNWNTGAERLKGYTAAEMVGHHFSKFYTKGDREQGLPARVLAIAAADGRYEAEGWRIRKDGSRFWASVVVDAIRDETGNLHGYAKVTRDITERRAALDALRESERQFRLLIGGVTDYALYMLDLNGVVTSWNAGAQRIKGYAASEILGQHFSRFYTERDRASGLPARALYTAAHDGRFEAEGWRVRKDGTMFWANVVIDPIRDEAGELIGFAKITRDITERRAAQRALEESQERHAYAQKMEALGQLTGGVAHDFNNLLMVVSGHVQTLKKAVEHDPKLARAAQAIELAARRGETLTRHLLSFSRRQTVQPTVLNVADHLESFRAMIGGSTKELTFRTAVPPDVWPVMLDVSEFELALVNLALNARDAMPQGGIVTITAENVLLASSDTPAGITGEFVALHMSDAGTGIAPDVLPKVFDPFFTTKAASSGTGLGLSQVHGFAHQSGGTVTVSSELGRGTTVTLYLPRGVAAPTAAPEPSSVETMGGGKVLLVEDNPEVAEVTAAMLEQLGYSVHQTGEPHAALSALEQHTFDILISDIVMPGDVDGLALARTVRATHKDLPVLLVTGYSKAARDVGSEFHILRKPFELGELSRTVERMIAESKQPETSNIVRLRSARAARASD